MWSRWDLTIRDHRRTRRAQAPADRGREGSPRGLRSSLPWVFAIVLAAAAPSGLQARIRQPIEYNHRLHTQDLEIACATCHPGVETAEQAGPPDLGTCLECHQEAITENPEEHKIQQYAAAGEPIRWTQLTRLPDHIYFSHRRHVAVARIDCAACHGPMELQTRPPGRALRVLKMSDCMACHEKSDASLDCNACHR